MYCTRRKRLNRSYNLYTTMLSILFKMTLMMGIMALIVMVFGDHVTHSMGTAAGVLVGNLIYFKLLHKS